MEVDPSIILGVYKLGVLSGAVGMYLVTMLIIMIVALLERHRKAIVKRVLIDKINEFDLKKNSPKDLKIFVLSEIRKKE